MKHRVRAGHVVNGKIVNYTGFPSLIGWLVQDHRGGHAAGGYRNFSRSDIRTSYIERLEYVESADTTVVFTRNSVYFMTGNAIKEFLGLDVKYAEGTEDILAQIIKHGETKKTTETVEGE